MEIMLVVGLIGVMTGVAMPIAGQAGSEMRLGMATRDVERALQTARLRSVSTNRPLRVRLNCPAPGQLRVVEVTHIAATDEDANRCDETRFPFPTPTDSDPVTPAHDGPVRTLPTPVTITGADVEFSADGTARDVTGGTRQPISSPVAITVTRYGATSTLLVNGLGKIEIQ